jgi:hypothetical protein
MRHLLTLIASRFESRTESAARATGDTMMRGSTLSSAAAMPNNWVIR